MVTIADIAKAAGVSRATVSLALNDKPGVAPETRKRIKEIAKKLNYKPNAFAKGLVLQRTETLGVIVPDISSPFYAELVRGVEQEASARGYHLILCTTAGKLSKEELYLRLLEERRIDGMILMTPRGDEEFISQIQKRGFPLVVVDRDIQAADEVVEVIVDNLHGALTATEHLIKLGYRRIGFINGIPELQASRDRLRGYQLALHEHKLPFRDEWICSGDFLEDGGYRCMRRLLSIKPPLEAVFIASDLMAIGALKAIKEVGKRVPDDIAIVGFDDISLAAHLDPPLTTVRQPMAEMGALACRLLLQLIEGEEVLQRKAILQTKLIVRASCGASHRKGVIDQGEQGRPERENLRAKKGEFQ